MRWVTKKVGSLHKNHPCAALNKRVILVSLINYKIREVITPLKMICMSWVKSPRINYLIN
ncbi:MAG: hypothetical protein Tp132SUR00d2C45923861_40 [Prokaryotic dsDNA virus sp.]|nr:MAG: hypothetical protein Tp132SUR00d2C45923861_40 [Prokaryotic dsDNA virus sp.]